MANLVGQVARQGAARNGAEDVSKDFFWTSIAGMSVVGLTHALQEGWVPKEHQSLAYVTAWIVAMYATNKAISLLGQGSKAAWKQCVDLTNKKIALKDTIAPVVSGLIAGYCMNGLLPPAAALGAGVLTSLTVAYSSST